MPVGRLALVLALLGGLALVAPMRAAAQPLIVVDAGHGGSDPGAVGCSLEEANVVLDVTTRLRSHLEAAGIRVALTRDADESVGLSARASFANSMAADGFVSIHSNSNAGTPATGTETWIANAAGDRSLALATLLQTEMVAAWGLRDRGVKRADFVVVRDTTMPAALAELAFTNNCATDATYLASMDRREEMAAAQARAILEWLGVEPTRMGTLRGVVFEDQGVGTMDLSVRLPGASVRIVETDALAAATAPDADWSFTLPPGTYTVEASAAGHTTASRRCDVTAGGTTWCSVGLFPASAATDAGSVTPDAALTDEPDAARAADASTTPAADTGLAARPTASGCSCRVGSAPRRPTGLVLALGLVLVLAIRRRWIAVLGSGIAVLALGTSCQPHALAPAALGEREPRRGHVVLDAPLGVAAERTLAIPLVDATAPMISPDGRTVLVARSDFDALYAFGERLTILCATPHCAYEPRFFGAGLVATRTPEQDASAIPGDAFTLEGQRAPMRLGARGALAWIEDERTLRVQIDGHTRTLARGQERFLRAELSPDHRFVVAWGLTRGLVLVRLSDDVRFELPGRGHPHFDPAGEVLVFDRTLDDGHAIVQGDIELAILDGEGDLHVRAVTSSERVETMPSVSAIDERGRARVAFDRDGEIVVAEIELPQ